MSSRILTLDVPLRWADMDAYRHINNVQIARILEEARVAAFGPPPAAPGAEGAQAPVPLFQCLPEGTQALVAEHHIKYRAPLPYSRKPARVEVWVGAVSAASLTVEYRIYDAESGRRCVDASTVLAFFNEPAGRLVRITAEQRRLLDDVASTD